MCKRPAKRPPNDSKGEVRVDLVAQPMTGVETVEQRPHTDPSAHPPVSISRPGAAFVYHPPRSFFVPECRSQIPTSLETDPTKPLRAARNSASVPCPHVFAPRAMKFGSASAEKGLVAAPRPNRGSLIRSQIEEVCAEPLPRTLHDDNRRFLEKRRVAECGVRGDEAAHLHLDSPDGYGTCRRCVHGVRDLAAGGTLFHRAPTWWDVLVVLLHGLGDIEGEALQVGVVFGPVFHDRAIPPWAIWW